jgi:hypothetical protein
MAITSVPVRVNEEPAAIAPVKSIPNYLKRSIVTIIRIFVVYKPFRFFMSIGVLLFMLGFLIGLRFLYYYVKGASGHVSL